MENGQFVRVNYTGRLESGEIFDLTDAEVAKKGKIFDENINYKPVPVIVGEGFLIPGLDTALNGMQVGDKKSVDVLPEQGFGQRNAALVKVLPNKVFEGKLDPKPGMVVDFSGMRGRIQSAEAGRVRVDFNNPLAGKVLKYDIEITEEIQAPLDKVKAILEFFGAENAEAQIDGSEVNIRIKLPEHMKERISALIIKHIDGIVKVSFIETYVKKG